MKHGIQTRVFEPIYNFRLALLYPSVLGLFINICCYRALQRRTTKLKYIYKTNVSNIGMVLVYMLTMAMAAQRMKQNQTHL
jgi:hypothetical protein